MKAQILLLVICLGIGINSLAASKKKNQVDPDQIDQNYQVPLQESKIDLSPLGVDYHPSVVEYELGVSNWMPSNLHLPSAVSGQTDFNQANIPELTINRITPWQFYSVGKLETLMGISFAQFSRSANLMLSSGHTGVTEDLNLTSLRFGLAFRFSELAKGWIQPTVMASVLPSWMAAGESEIEPNGASAYGLPLEFALQVMVSPPGMRARDGQAGGGFGLGVHQTMGSVGGYDVSGTGVDLLTRFAF